METTLYAIMEIKNTGESQFIFWNKNDFFDYLLLYFGLDKCLKPDIVYTDLSSGVYFHSFS